MLIHFFAKANLRKSSMFMPSTNEIMKAIGKKVTKKCSVAETTPDHIEKKSISAESILNSVQLLRSNLSACQLMTAKLPCVKKVSDNVDLCSDDNKVLADLDRTISSNSVMSHFALKKLDSYSSLKTDPLMWAELLDFDEGCMDMDRNLTLSDISMKGLEKLNSNRSVMSGPLISLDLTDLDGGLIRRQAAGSNRSIISSDFVKEAFLSEADCETMVEKNVSCPNGSDTEILELTAKLGRITTGDDIITENIRLSSNEWGNDFQSDWAVDMSQTVLCPSSENPTVTSPESDFRTLDVSNHESELPSNEISFINHDYQSFSSDSSINNKSKQKTKRKRIIDESTICEPTPNDVLFGRGGFTNSHPGNIFFRQEALKLRHWYAESSKEQKYEISDLLVESVKSLGNRFLEKGRGGLWHEVIGNGARKKASQALRERIKGKKIELKRSSVSHLSNASLQWTENAFDDSEGLTSSQIPTTQ